RSTPLRSARRDLRDNVASRGCNPTGMAASPWEEREPPRAGMDLADFQTNAARLPLMTNMLIPLPDSTKQDLLCRFLGNRQARLLPCLETAIDMADTLQTHVLERSGGKA